MNKNLKITLWAAGTLAVLGTAYHFYNKKQKAQAAKLASENTPAPVTQIPVPDFVAPPTPAPTKTLIPKGIKNLNFDPTGLPTIAIAQQNLASSFDGNPSRRNNVDREGSFDCCGNA